MNVQSYLRRIGVTENPVVHNLPYLSHLQRQHLLHIHFENLDILRGTTIKFDIESVYQKIVEQQRGGICFELNGLFNELLRKLGFSSYFVAGTVYQGDGRWAPLENSHMAILVELENGNYLIDVGFGGGSPRKPIPLSGEEVVDVDEAYRIVKDENVLFVHKKMEQEWTTLYRFTTDRKQFDDFQQVCHLIETSPESTFSHKYFLSKVTDNGRISLIGDSLTIVSGGNKTKVQIESDNIVQTIEEYFGFKPR